MNLEGNKIIKIEYEYFLLSYFVGGFFNNVVMEEKNNLLVKK